MTEQNEKHVLLCVAGMTPQIITETLWALTQEQQIRVDEIRVITTLAGRNKVLKELLDPAQGKFFAFCRDFGIVPGSIKFDETTIALLRLPDGSQLEDIRTATDNEHAANQICEIVYALTRNPQTKLHASVAGGRKTMSIYLTTAMQLFGRVPDRLSHVLVSEEFETHREFYYKPPVACELEISNRLTGETRRLSTAQAEIHLADIPFIRLRGVLSDWIGDGGRSYSALVRRAQSDLDVLESVHDLHLGLRERTVRVADRSAKLAEREFFFYLLFAYLRKQGRGAVAVTEITRADLDAVFRLITSARETELGLEECSSYPRYDFLANFAAQLEQQKGRDVEDARKTVTETRAKLNHKLERAELPQRYLLETQGERGQIRYRILTPPERILWA